MKVQFLDMEEEKNPLNGSLIDSAVELENLLDQLRDREPFGFQLESENGFTMVVLLAREFGSLQQSSASGAPPYLVAVAPGSPEISPVGDVSPFDLAFVADKEKGATPPEFLVGGTLTPVPTRYCLPYGLVKDIAVKFLKTGDRALGVKWEEI